MATLHQLRSINNRISGRLALVTGASGGIGSACTKALADEGCDVSGYGAQESAESLARELSEKYPEQLFLTERQTSSPATPPALVPRILQNPEVAARHTAISILVANAGRARRARDISEIDEDDWDDVLEVNARSQFVITKACVPGMRLEGWGRVILIGSIASRGEGSTVSPAMIGSTGLIPAAQSQTWASGTDINTLQATDPGLAIATHVPVQRLGEPEEVANIVIMLAKTGYVTGQDILLAGA
ncbi:unnamed protein product [Parascedosporium putredinis]|uniref:NAD(P)-binding protein n=1 Tax=Parascedosporium putredinis TaxID=1442378 RepID=A0A9P1M7U8_9PEZI|nr:unnamed protein product [Parascedosporium putredinis]CAI7992379.1 unnamed protein product [Parascedosporium putredinis]